MSLIKQMLEQVRLKKPDSPSDPLEPLLKGARSARPA
jgi:hypothetical protein